MRRVLSPIDKGLLSEASIFDIGRCSIGSNLYFYSVREWYNGAKGAIVDLFDICEPVDSDGNSLYVKEGGRNFGHIDVLQFVSSEIDLVQESERCPGLSDLWMRCPTVAEGIIARFVKVDITDRDYPKMFEAYYEMEKVFYAKERKMRDPYTFNVNLEDEFANGAHLLQEMRKIEFSLQNLLPFIKESQHAQIKRTADAYIEFVKGKATNEVNSQSEAEDGGIRNGSNKVGKNCHKNEGKHIKRYSFRLNISSKKQEKSLEALYTMLSQIDDKGKRFIDGDLMKNNEVDEEILSNVKEIKDENIKNTIINKYLFNQVFSGQDTDVQIVWTGNANELWYFISTLYNYYVEFERADGKSSTVRLLEKSGSEQGVWQIVCSRFLNGKPRKVLDERIGKMVVISTPVEFEPKDFHKYSEKNSPRNTFTLDAIINKIAPPRIKTDKEAIEEEFNPHKYGIKSPKSPEKLEGDLHDTSHKSKFI